jgi:hypothetical protein
MKRAFIIIGVAAVAGLVMSACIDLEPLPEGPGSSSGDGDAGPGSTDGADETAESGCAGDCPAPHDLSGELLLFVNGRLSNADALYQSNVPLPEAGTFLGPSLYLYDPARACDDGGNACRLVELGHLRLDERLGQVSVEDGSLAKFTLRELAWSPTAGLWAVSYDVQNDEWGIARLDVPSFAEADQEIGVERFAIVPGDAASPSTDPCYWQEGVSGLEFLGDELYLGVRGMGGSGIPTNGAVFRVASSVLEQGHCVYDNDVSQDPAYYACDVLCQPWAQFPAQLGIAGDLAPDADEAALLGVVRSENAALMPLDRQELYRMVAPADGELVSAPVSTGIFATGIAPGIDIEGLVRIGGLLYGIDVLGAVYVFDEARQAVSEHDDLSALFPDFELALRVRGATRVVVDHG